MKKSNVEILCDYEDFVEFRTTCQCCSDNHELTVIVEDWNEKDKSSPPRPMVSFCFTCGRYENSIDDNFFKRLINRFKDALKIIFTGELHLDGDFIFRDDETNHLKDFRNTLDEAIKQVEECKQQSKETKV